MGRAAPNRLGFTVIERDRIKSYIDERDDFVVYADPRGLGEIGFIVYRKPLPKRGRGLRLHAMANSFGIRDSWKNDLKAKYEARVTQALTRLVAQRQQQMGESLDGSR